MLFLLYSILQNLGVKVFTSGCLGACEHGPVAVQYPDGEFLLGVTQEDLPEILEDLAKD